MTWRRLGAAVVILLGLAAPAARAALPEPLLLSNLSPFTRTFGIPAPVSPWLLPAGTGEAALTIDLANNYIVEENRRESVLLDGETLRLGLRCRHASRSGWLYSGELPLYHEGGGTLDGFIENWHASFNLPNGGRDLAPRDRFLDRYTVDGETRLAADESASGLGDLQLAAARSLYISADATTALAVQGTLKLPTGARRALYGSGAVDAALALSAGSLEVNRAGRWSTLASAGLLYLGPGELLPARQKDFATFASLTCAYAPTQRLDLKVQIDAHTPFYSSALTPVGGNSVQLGLGGTLQLGATTVLDLAVTEDLLVGSAPDVGFHLALRRRY